MPGQFAARLGDPTSAVAILMGSPTIHIGMAGAGSVSCSPSPKNKDQCGCETGNPVSPLLGAKILVGETDFALPSAALPLVWSRTYSSYVNAEHGGACGVLGYGWYLFSCDTRLDLQSRQTLLFDAAGRTITFPEPLPPGGILHSPTEGIWLLRGGEGAPVPWRTENPAFGHVPPEWAADPDCVIVTDSNKSLLQRFTQPPGQTTWHLTEERDRLGTRRHYHWRASPPGQPDEPSSFLLAEISDGAARRYRLHYLPLYPSRPASGPGWRDQAGWRADSGWRLIQIELTQTAQDDPALNECFPDVASREAFLSAQAALRHPDLPDVRGIVLVRYDYDKSTGDLIRVRDRANTITREFGTHNHLMTAHRHRGGPLHRYQYEALLPGAKVIAQHNEGGLNYSFTYHEDAPEQSRAIVLDSLGREETHHFKGQGGLKRLVKLERADGSLFTQEYSAAGHLICLTDPLGQKTNLFRDAEGRLIDLEDPAHRHTLAEYNELGQLIRIEEAGRLTRYQYDLFGRLTRTTHPDETREEYQYSEPGAPAADLPARLIDERGGVKHLQWSSAGRLLSYTDCSHKSTHYRYNLWGSLLSESNALNERTRFTRDHTDKLTAVTLPDESLIRYEYDAKDRLSTITAPDGTQHRFAWDAHDQLTERIDAAGRRRHYQYDLAGRLTGLKNENGAHARFEYDLMDRLIRESGFDRRTQRYRYDRLGQLTEKIEESLSTRPTTRYDYDEAGNLTARHLPANGRILALVERFEWDEVGQLATAHGLNGKVDFDYDKRGRLIGETQIQQRPDVPPWQWKHSQETNELGVKQRSHYGELPAIDWLTYGVGHLHGIRFDDLGIDLERDDLHREISRNIRRERQKKLLFSQDTAYTVLGSIATRALSIGGIEREKRHYSYDKLNRLIEIDETLSGKKIHYSYDPAGRLIGSRHGARSFHYQFDAADNRIDPTPSAAHPVPEENWAETVRKRLDDPDFNPLGYTGQPKAHTASHLWPDNRITHLHGITNTFDASGNLTEQTRPDGTHLQMHYDGANRLAALTRTNPDGAKLEAWYVYDAFSRRIAKGVTEHGVEKVTRYGWEGDKLAHEATEETLTTVIYARSFAPVMRVEQSVKKEVSQEEQSEEEQAMAEVMKIAEATLAACGAELEKPTAEPSALTVSFFVTDHAGTPGKLIDTQGKIVWEAEPDDWAAVRDEKGVRQPIRFQGQWVDEETGFYYNRYRYYDPQQGRYITQDPIGLEGGINLYSYPMDPVEWVDPWGLNRYKVTRYGLKTTHYPYHTETEQTVDGLKQKQGVNRADLDRLNKNPNPHQKESYRDIFDGRFTEKEKPAEPTNKPPKPTEEPTPCLWSRFKEWFAKIFRI
jgi:RHS repeat-associated protein